MPDTLHDYVLRVSVTGLIPFEQLPNELSLGAIGVAADQMLAAADAADTQGLTAVVRARAGELLIQPAFHASENPRPPGAFLDEPGGLLIRAATFLPFAPFELGALLVATRERYPFNALVLACPNQLLLLARTRQTRSVGVATHDALLDSWMRSLNVRLSPQLLRDDYTMIERKARRRSDIEVVSSLVTVASERGIGIYSAQRPADVAKLVNRN